MNSAVRALRLGRFAGCASFAFAFASLALSVMACTPHIGDKCILSTDCSVSGTLVCDTSQVGGYCTQVNCTRLSCPADTTCVMFHASVPGCAYDDYRSPSRTGRTFCMENCGRDSDCRAGYVCRDPSSGPWNAAILDDNQSQGVCISLPAIAEPDAAPNENAAVCQPYFADGGSSGDASSDAGNAGASDSSFGSFGDGAVDAASVAPADTGSADASGGG